MSQRIRVKSLCPRQLSISCGLHDVLISIVSTNHSTEYIWLKKSKPKQFSVKTFPMFVQNVSIPHPYPSYKLLLTFQYQGGWIMACTATEREYRIDRSSQPHRNGTRNHSISIFILNDGNVSWSWNAFWSMNNPVDIHTLFTHRISLNFIKIFLVVLVRERSKQR
jgi:hypothetical protein